MRQTTLSFGSARSRRVSRRDVAAVDLGDLLTVDLTDIISSDDEVTRVQNTKRTRADIDDVQPAAKQPRLMAQNESELGIKIEQIKNENDAIELISVDNQAANTINSADESISNGNESAEERKLFQNISANESIVFDNNGANLDVSIVRENVNNSVVNFKLAFDQICDLNEKLEKTLNDAETERNELNEQNTILLAQIEELKNETNKAKELKEIHDKEIADLKQLHAKELQTKIDAIETEFEQKLKKELNILREAQEVELARMRLRYTGKITALKMENQTLNVANDKCAEIERAMEQCKNDYLVLIEDAKKKKFCAACGKSKPLDLYVCDVECQRKCW